MLWLFERTVEFAAWVAMIVAWIAAVTAAIWLVRWFGTLRTIPDFDLLRDSAKAAATFVGFSVALGVLACIDRFLFDAEPGSH
jgi:O-antigen/teichoic acid export membrane protein